MESRKCEYELELKVMVGSFAYFIISSVVWSLYNLWLYDRLTFFAFLPAAVFCVLVLVPEILKFYDGLHSSLCEPTARTKMTLEERVITFAVELMGLALASLLLLLVVKSWKNDFFSYNILIVAVLNTFIMVKIIVK